MKHLINKLLFIIIYSAHKKNYQNIEKKIKIINLFKCTARIFLNTQKIKSRK